MLTEAADPAGAVVGRSDDAADTAGSIGFRFVWRSLRLVLFVGCWVLAGCSGDSGQDASGPNASASPSLPKVSTVAPRPVVLPAAPPPIAGCSANIIDHRDIDHRALGPVRLFLLQEPQEIKGCVAAITGVGQVLPAIPIDAYSDEFAFASPVTDATGNAFVTYNPGRYNGVLVLVPTADGFQDIGWDDRSGTHYSGKRAYYNAELGDLGADGKYTIRQFHRETPPGCMGSPCQITTSQDLHWNGNDYAP